MTIYSLTFIFLFLPSTMLIFILAPKRLKNYTLCVASLLFYWLNSPTILAAVMANTTFDFLCGRFIFGNKKLSRKISKVMLYLLSAKSIIFVLSFSVYAELNYTFYLLGVTVGAFTSLGYLIDLYHDECDVVDNFFEYIVFCCFFGKLYIGPLVSSKQFVPQLASLKFSSQKFVDGFVYYCHGYAKIVILANAANTLAQQLLDVQYTQVSLLGVWVYIAANLFSVYYTLSGYSDMARGIGNFFGITLPPNFHYPFQSESVTQFFSNFNISANRFVRKYIYKSLGAEDNGAIATITNIMLITMVMGLWYGVSLNRVFWGGFLGIFITIETLLGEQHLEKIPRFIRQIGTFIIVTLSFAIYSSSSLANCWFYLKIMLGINHVTIADPVSLYIVNAHILVLLILFVCSTGFFSSISKKAASKMPVIWQGLSVFTNIYICYYHIVPTIKEGNMLKRLYALIISAFVVCITATTMYITPFSFNEKIVAGIAQPIVSVSDTQQYFKDNLIMANFLKSMNLFINKTVGYVEIDNVFLTDDGLIKRYLPSHDGSDQENTNAAINYASASLGHTVVMILPTAGAIYQDKLPMYATDTMVNEKLYIEETNKLFSGAAMTVNSYTNLFNNRNSYIYFNTHNSLTMLGGYMAYSTLMQRLGITPVPQSSYKIQYVNNVFYGDNAALIDYQYGAGDTVAQYHYTSNDTLSLVQHWQRYENKQYSTLYPTASYNLLSPKDSILGGMSPRIDITTYDVENSQKLLVIGDENALSIIPFLTRHYSEITFVNPNLLTVGEMKTVQSYDYALTLFAMSIETFTNTAWGNKISSITVLPPVVN